MNLTQRSIEQGISISDYVQNLANQVAAGLETRAKSLISNRNFSELYELLVSTIKDNSSSYPASMREIDREISIAAHDIQYFPTGLDPSIEKIAEEGARVIDIGAGQGDFSKRLANRGPVVAIEPADLSLAARRDSSILHLRTSVFLPQLKSLDNQAEKVFCLMFTPRDLSYILCERGAMFLRPGGEAIFTSEQSFLHHIAMQVNRLAEIKQGTFIVDTLRCRFDHVPDELLTDWTDKFRQAAINGKDVIAFEADGETGFAQPDSYPTGEICSCRAADLLFHICYIKRLGENLEQRSEQALEHLGNQEITIKRRIFTESNNDSLVIYSFATTHRPGWTLAQFSFKKDASDGSWSVIDGYARPKASDEPEQSNAALVQLIDDPSALLRAALTDFSSYAASQGDFTNLHVLVDRPTICERINQPSLAAEGQDFDADLLQKFLAKAAYETGQLELVSVESTLIRSVPGAKITLKLNAGNT